MISCSMAHIKQKGVDADIHNSLTGVLSQPSSLESCMNIGIAAKEHTVTLAEAR